MTGLRDTRKDPFHRVEPQNLSQDELIRRQDAQIKLLQEQVELLKKLDEIERRVAGINNFSKPQEAFQLIHDTITKYNLQGIWRREMGLLIHSERRGNERGIGLLFIR